MKSQNLNFFNFFYFYIEMCIQKKKNIFKISLILPIPFNTDDAKTLKFSYSTQFNISNAS